MPKSRPWSSVSAPCRLEWRPSRAFAAALAVLGLLGAVGVIVSELPGAVALALGAVSTCWGARLAMTELRRPALSLVIPHGAAQATIDGKAVTDLELHWRGVLGFLRWRDASGRWRHLQGWPDNLDAAARRELRLAMQARLPARVPRSMAP